MKRLRVAVVDLMSTTPRRPARRMFVDVLDRAAHDLGVLLSWEYHPADLSLPVDRCGVDWFQLATSDAVIVTGSEPKYRRLHDEPALTVVRRVLDVAGESVVSTLFSCQSAHAALHVLHGLPRQRLERKCHGVLSHDVAAPDQPLARGLAAGTPVPHSRWNAMATRDLRNAGVVPVLTTTPGEWGLAVSRDGLRYVFWQGHPEYAPQTLLREYRRDLLRWFSGESTARPAVPTPYLNETATALLARYTRELAAAPDRDPFEAFPIEQLALGITVDWQVQARVFYENWLRAVCARREHESEGHHRYEQRLAMALDH